MWFVRLTMLIYRVTSLYRRGSSFLPQHRLHQLVHSWKPPIKQHPVQEKTILDAQMLVRGNLPQSSWAETNQGTNSREPQQRDTLGTSFSSSEPLNSSAASEIIVWTPPTGKHRWDTAQQVNADSISLFELYWSCYNYTVLIQLLRKKQKLYLSKLWLSVTTQK